MSLTSVGGDENEWRDEARCRDTDPDQFFPVGMTLDVVRIVEAAKALCSSCPVREACLQYAMPWRRTRTRASGVEPRRRSAAFSAKRGWLGGGPRRRMSARRGGLWLLATRCPQLRRTGNAAKLHRSRNDIP